MSEPIIEYRDEFNVMDFASKYAERISRVIDEQTLANVEHQLAMYGYVKVVRCRDCKHATISTMGVCKYCEMFVLPDTDGYGADAQVNLPLDFFCAWGEKRTNE